MAWLAAALAIAGSTGVQGQGIGLQVADTADVRPSGETEVTAGMLIGKTITSSAGRVTYSFADELRGFFDLGWSKPEESKDGNVAVQAGAIYALPIEGMSELGLRAAAYYVDTDSVDIKGTSLMLISSGETLEDGLYAYGGIGADLSSREVEITRSVNSSRSELNPALTIGALYFFTPRFSAYLEASYVDVPMIGCGVRFSFSSAP
jgi:hypothetical protein